jgi:hypothetical protein
MRFRYHLPLAPHHLPQHGRPAATPKILISDTTGRPAQLSAKRGTQYEMICFKP